MIFKDYYKILGFDDNKANAEQIKIAYREQAKKYHPDVNGANRNTEERFKDINEAYRILSDTVARRKYDRAWNVNIGRRKNREKYGNKEEKTDSIKEGLFGMFFGYTPKKNKKQEENIGAKKGEDVETEIEITLEEAFYGKTKKISLRTVSGNLKTITVKVPAGIRNKERIRLVGQGKKGAKDEKPGDLFIKVKVLESNKFTLNGYNLHTKLFVTPWEAILGGQIEVQGIDDIEKIKLEKGTTSGTEIIVENKGFKDGKGRRGNLICEIQIMVPNKITEEEEEIYRKLQKISKFNPRTTKTDKKQVDIL